MEWPPQNTTLFAPPSCATCCETIVPEAEAYVQGYQMTIGGVVQQLPKIANASSLSYTVSITPVTRTPEGIVAVGYVSWNFQDFGDLTGTSEECNGCYGYSCLDGDGNPYGGTWGYLPDLVPCVWDFYVISAAEHGKATDLAITYNFNIYDALGKNMPTCEEFGSTYVNVLQTVIW